MRIRTMLRWTLGFCLFATIVVVSMLVLARRTQLMSRATAVYHLENLEYYHWLSDSELLLIRARMTGPDEADWRFFRRDVRFGKETPLPRLGARFPKDVDAPEYSRMSPDRRWLLWRFAAYIGAVTIDGTRTVSWVDRAHENGTANDELYWQNDNQHFIELTNAPDWKRLWGAVIRDVDKPDETRTVPAPFVPQLAASQYYASAFATPRGELLTFAPMQEQTGYKTLLYVPLAPDGKARTYKITAPHGMFFNYANPNTCNAVALSDSGDRIAWFCHSAPYTPLQEMLLRRVSAHLPPHRYVREELCISDADGTDMHSIGGIEMNADDYGTPSDLRWLPHGKQVSFEFDGTLYAVPVD